MHQLSRSLEKVLEDAAVCGELKLSGRKISRFPKLAAKLNLQDTTYADLSKNRFSELPEDLTSFPFLETLILYQNVIRSIPDSISNLLSLQYLDLRNNQLAVLPKEICLLSLKVLLVSNNRLIAMPEEIGRMETLTEIDGSYNQIASLPVRMADLRNLRSLILRNNQLLYLPRDITALQLISLDISGNRIASLPVELRRMTSLVVFDCSNNPLTSPPAALCNHGLIHICKYLDQVANKDDKPSDAGSSLKRGVVGTPKMPHHAMAAPAPAASSAVDGAERKRLPNSLNLRPETTNGAAAPPRKPIFSPKFGYNGTSNSSTPASENNNDSATSSPSRITGASVAGKPLGSIQTYKEYKEALRQQRNQELNRTREQLTSPDTDGTDSPSRVKSTSSSSQNSPDSQTKLSSLLAPRQNGHALVNGNHSPAAAGDTEHNAPSYIKPSAPTLASNIAVPRASASTAGGSATTAAAKKIAKTVSWNRDLPGGGEKRNFTMRREHDKHKEEAELIHQLRQIIKTRLKIALPEDLATALMDGVVLCHLANHVKPRSVASIHVPSATTPKLTMTRCRRNVDNFLDAVAKIGVDDKLICSAADILEGRGVVQIAITVIEVLKFHSGSSSASRIPGPPTLLRTASEEGTSDG